MASRTVWVNDAGQVIGQDHHRAKLSDHDIELIQRLRAQGWGYPAIAAKMEIARSTAFYICTGQRRGQSYARQRTLQVKARPPKARVPDPGAVVGGTLLAGALGARVVAQLMAAG